MWFNNRRAERECETQKCRHRVKRKPWLCHRHLVSMLLTSVGVSLDINSLFHSPFSLPSLSFSFSLKKRRCVCVCVDEAACDCVHIASHWIWGDKASNENETITDNRWKGATSSVSLHLLNLLLYFHHRHLYFICFCFFHFIVFCVRCDERAFTAALLYRRRIIPEWMHNTRTARTLGQMTK